MTLSTILQDTLKGKFVEVYLYKTTEGRGYCTLEKRNEGELKDALITDLDITEEDHEAAYIELVVDLCGIEYRIDVNSNYTDIKFASMDVLIDELLN